MEKIKVLLAGAVCAMAVQLFAATPTVTAVTAQQRYPWDGLVDIVVTISGEEALFGARKCGASKLEGCIGLFKELFPVVTWDADSSEAYAGIRAELERTGKPIGEMDMLIAASAMAGGFTLVTNNERHFGRIKDLAIVNWAK